jgi:hypothetical protein
VVVRKNISKMKGEQVLFDEIRYLFYITTRTNLSAAEETRLLRPENATPGASDASADARNRPVRGREAVVTQRCGPSGAPKRRRAPWLALFRTSCESPL